MNEEFLKRMQEYLKDDYDKYLLALNKPKIRGLRINNNYLQEEDFLSMVDFNVKPIVGLENAFFIQDDLKFGFHPLHHAGAFYIQDPSAMLPVLAYKKIADIHLILDLCASPGGKTLELATIYQDAIIISNEIDFKRAQVLYSNVERFGLKNVIVTNNRPEDFLKSFTSCFDLILLDAPCSGEGMIRKLDEDLKWSQDYVNKCHLLDLSLINVANQLLKKDGHLLYSTCTFSKEEDEMIVDKLTNDYRYEIIDMQEDLKKYVSPGFTDNTYRIYPFNEFGEGQFFSMLKKKDGSSFLPKRNVKRSDNNIFKSFCKENLDIIIDNIKIVNDVIYYDNLLDLNGLRVLNYGVKLGSIEKNIFKPNHYFFKVFYKHFINQINLDFKDKNVNKYLHGEQINHPCLDGYGVLLVNNIPLGGFKAKNGVLNNLYPRGLRNF